MTPHDDPATQATLDEWVSRLAAALRLDANVLDSDAVLALAGTVAHRIVRPAAPLTTYLVGLAVGRAIERGDDPQSAFEDAVARARTASDEASPAP